LIGKKLAQNIASRRRSRANGARSYRFRPDYLPAQRELAEDLLRLGQNDAGWVSPKARIKKMPTT